MQGINIDNSVTAANDRGGVEKGTEGFKGIEVATNRFFKDSTGESGSGTAVRVPTKEELSEIGIGLGTNLPSWP